MLGQAISKLKDEMKKEKASFVQIVGQFLLAHVEADPASAEKILVEGKSIKGSLDAMRKEAKKQMVDNCAVLSDQEGFAVVLQYFAIKGKVTATAIQEAASTKVKPVNNSSVDFDVSLEDFL